MLDSDGRQETSDGSGGRWYGRVETSGDFQTLMGRGSTSNARTTSCSSIFLRRMIGSMFMRVNSKCAHHVRPPLSRMKRRLTVCRPSATREDLSLALRLHADAANDKCRRRHRHDERFHIFGVSD